MRICRLVATVRVAVLVAAAFSLSAHAQQTRGTASQQTASHETGDFVEGNLSFHRVGGFIQVTDTEKKAVAGTIIVQPGGALMYAPMPGYDIRSAYEKHMSGGASAAQTASAGDEGMPKGNASQAPFAAASPTGFDASRKTVTLPNGRSVTFVDNDNLKVEIPGTAGIQTYDLHYHGTSGGQFAQVWARSEMGHTGMGSGLKGPLAGGVTITAEPKDGMPGGKLYDTLEGGNLASAASLRPRLQPIIDAVKDAAEMVKPVEPKLAEAKVVKTLLNNNLVQ